jgi:hypothetical protein
MTMCGEQQESKYVRSGFLRMQYELDIAIARAHTPAGQLESTFMATMQVCHHHRIVMTIACAIGLWLQSAGMIIFARVFFIIAKTLCTAAPRSCSRTMPTRSARLLKLVWFVHFNTVF